MQHVSRAIDKSPYKTYLHFEGVTHPLREQQGRLRCTNNLSTIDQVPLQSVQELIAYDGTEDLLRDLLDRFSEVSGVSGVQPKVLVKDILWLFLF